MPRPGLAAVVLLGVLSACTGEGEIPTVPTPRLPLVLPEGFTAEIFAEGLELPTSVAFPPDGSPRLFVNELQTGRVRIVENGTLLPQPFAELETNTAGGFPVDGENGLLGIAFDPQYTATRYVYVTYATRTDSGTFGTVARFTDVNGRGEEFTVLLEGVPSAPGHQIQSLTFGPDGMLYVSAGDAFRDEEAQDPASPAGKILRIHPDGRIPDDNPFPGTYTYALGFRNAFDLAFDDASVLVATDNGPERDDELNRIVAGGNYGWPAVVGAGSDPRYVDPLHVWAEIVAPAGMAFYRAAAFPEPWRGKLFLVLFGRTFTAGPSDRAKRVQAVDLDVTPPAFDDFAVYDFPDTGNPVDVTVGPDGALYVSDIFQGRVFRISYRP